MREEIAAFRAELIAMRKQAGLTQRQLAKRLGREHSFVGRIELGERRVDVLEFFWICRACGFDPAKTSAKVMRILSDEEKRDNQSTKRTRSRRSRK